MNGHAEQDLNRQDLQKRLMSIHFFEESVYMERIDKSTGQASMFMVSPHALMERFAVNTVFCTGILPAKTVFFCKKGEVETIAVYSSPGKRKMTLVLSDTFKKEYELYMPGYVFWGSGTEYGIVAVEDEQISGSTRVAPMPTPNVFNRDGSICMGDMAVPICTINNIRSIEQLFWTSDFNKDYIDEKCKSHPDNLLALWDTLQETNAVEFPKNELLYGTDTLKDVMDSIGKQP